MDDGICNQFKFLLYSLLIRYRFSSPIPTLHPIPPMVVSPTPSGKSLTSAGYPTVQHNSDMT